MSAKLYIFYIFLERLFCKYFTHYKNAGLFQPKFGSYMDKPKCWVKNVISKTSTFTFNCNFF